MRRSLQLEITNAIKNSTKESVTSYMTIHNVASWSDMNSPYPTLYNDDHVLLVYSDKYAETSINSKILPNPPKLHVEIEDDKRVLLYGDEVVLIDGVIGTEPIITFHIMDNVEIVLSSPEYYNDGYVEGGFDNYTLEFNGMETKGSLKNLCGLFNELVKDINM